MIIFEFFGVSGIIIFIVCLLACIIDIINGQPLFVLFDEYMNRELYKTAAEKRADPDRYNLLEERQLVYKCYKSMLRAAREYQGLETYKVLREAYKQRDYKTLYNLYLDINCTINGDDWENYKDDMI